MEGKTVKCIHTYITLYSIAFYEYVLLLRYSLRRRRRIFLRRRCRHCDGHKRPWRAAVNESKVGHRRALCITLYYSCIIVRPLYISRRPLGRPSLFLLLRITTRTRNGAVRRTFHDITAFHCLLTS